MLRPNKPSDFVNFYQPPPLRQFPLFLTQPWLNAGFMINTFKVPNYRKTYWTNVPVPKIQTPALVGGNGSNNYTGYAVL
jgi:hypothetical protein